MRLIGRKTFRVIENCRTVLDVSGTGTEQDTGLGTALMNGSLVKAGHSLKRLILAREAWDGPSPCLQSKAQH
jgi:hypothetical protein